MRALRKELAEENKVKEFLKILSKKIETENEIVLFGAGTGGKRFWEWLSGNVNRGTKKVKYFVDNNPLRWGQVFPDYGAEIINPDVFLDSYSNELVIITCGEGDVISEQICKGGGGYTAGQDNNTGYFINRYIWQRF